MTQPVKAMVGEQMYKFLRKVLPAEVDLGKVQEALQQGNFKTAGTCLQEKFSHLREYPLNPFDDDPARVAERLTGTPILYMNNLQSNVTALITRTAAFYQPRGNCPELFSADPGTIGRFFNPGRGGYSAILVAAHKPGTTGVISIEEATVDDKRLQKTDIADLFHCQEEAGTSIAHGTSRIVLAAGSDHCPRGYKRLREELNGGVYFSLRQK